MQRSLYLLLCNLGLDTRVPCCPEQDLLKIPGTQFFKAQHQGVQIYFLCHFRMASTPNFGPILCFKWLHWGISNFGFLLIVGGSIREKLCLQLLRVSWGFLPWEHWLFSFSLEFSRPGAAHSNAYMGEASDVNGQSHCRCETRGVGGDRGSLLWFKGIIATGSQPLMVEQNASQGCCRSHFLKKKK